MMHITMAALGSVLAFAIAAGPAFAQRSDSPPRTTEGKEIRVVGCVQWEKDYRRARNEGRGGALGSGVGAGDEFVLTFAQVERAGGRTAAPSVGTAGNGGGKKLTEGAAYSITGDREKELARRIGQQVEVIGTVEERGDANSERAGDLPRIKMTAWIPMKDFCPAQ
jgi:hypothetical protein